MRKVGREGKSQLPSSTVVTPGMAIWYRFGVKLVAALVIAIYLPVVCPASNPQWTLVRSPHFEVYSQTGERDGRSALLWFERLRAFFVQAGVVQAGADLEGHGPVRVIGFGSEKEFAAFQPQRRADAYFLGGDAANYIVMRRLGPEEFGVAAHEYAHVVIHSLGLQLPAWLAEGIAEFFSSIHITEKECLVGGDLPMRTLVLRRSPWIPLGQLLTAGANPAMQTGRNEPDLFYAESWALTRMLILSPAYAPRFNELLDAAASGTSDASTVSRIYGKPLNSIAVDLQAWIQKPRPGVPLAGVSSVDLRVEVSGLTRFESGLMLADLMFAAADLEHAEAAYRALENERPDDGAVHAALGSIAVLKGDRDRARQQWKRAIQLGIRDAKLYYRYATLAEDAGSAADEVAGVLQRAIELKPDFDDARYKLGLLENNCGHYEAALRQFRAMRPVGVGRAYGYWTAIASALTELNQRGEAKEAAATAMLYAASAEERATASRMAYVAGTDLTVQLSHDADGNPQMITARKPHGSDEWNPFIEPGDHIVSVEGRLRKVECESGKITGFRVEGTAAVVEVVMADPTQVLIRGGTPEFMCGADDGRRVAIQYAAFEKRTTADGVLRGMQFR